MKKNQSGWYGTEGTYTNRLFLQFLLLVTIPLIVMGAVSYQIYVRGEFQRRSQELTSYCESVETDYENIFSSVKEYYLDGTKHEEFAWLREQAEIPLSSYKEMKQAQKMLEGNFFLRKYISMYSFFHVKGGWLLSNYGMAEEGEIRNREEASSFLEEQELAALSVYWLNRTSEPQVYGSRPQVSRMYDTSGELLILKENDNSGGLVYVLSVRMNLKELEELSQTYRELGCEVTVLSEGRVMTQTDGGFTEACLGRNLQAGSGVRIPATLSLPDGRKFLTVVREGKENGMVYIMGYDLSFTKKGGIVFVAAALSIILIFGVLLVLLRFAARIFSRPVMTLHKFVEDQNIQIRELFVSDLIKGEIDTEKIRDALDKCGEVPRNAYRLMGISFKPEGGGAPSDRETDESYRAVLERLPEAIREQIFIRPILYQHMIVCMIGDEDDVSVDSRTATVYKLFKDYIWEETGRHIAVGIGRTFHRLTHARGALGECVEAIHSRNHEKYENRSSLTLYDDYSLMDDVGNVYDKVMENELLQALEGGDEETGRLLELLIERMEVKELVGIERSFYLTRLLSEILSVPVTAGLSLSDIFEGEHANILERVTKIYDYRELIRSIREEILGPIMEKLSEKSTENAETDIVKSVVGLLKESKGNITLNECADRLSYHPNYLSRVLKKEKGKTFTEMANEETLRHAKYMLLTTEYSVAEIADRLHYGNVQNFIRFFKNHVKVTPAVFRKEHRK